MIAPHPHLPPRLASAPQAVQVYMWLANGELLPCLPMGSSPRQVHMWCGALLATYAQPTHVFF